MVCIDTCVWVSIYRNASTPLAEAVLSLSGTGNAAFCGQVWVELIGGYRRADHRQFLVDRFRLFPWLETTREAYELAAEWMAVYRGLGTGDAIIAATAKIHRASLLTIDKGFEVLRGAGLELEPVPKSDG